MERDIKTGRIKKRDLTGHRFDRLLVVRFSHQIKGGACVWECKCDCGAIKLRRSYCLLVGKNQSCGCLKREINRAARKRLQTTHGLSDTPVGNVWMGMMDRCFNPNSKDSRNYRCRGITVCEFIRATPANLLFLLGNRPPGTSLDRKNNNGHYSCGQCSECMRNGWEFNIRWATIKQQCRNKRTSRVVEIDSVIKCACEWADEFGINRSTFYARLKAGVIGKDLLIKPC